MNELRTNWIQLKRLVGINPATPLPGQGGQLRYVRADGTIGVLYLARDNADNSLTWEQLNGMLPLTGGTVAGSLTVTGNTTFGNSDTDITQIRGHIRVQGAAPAVAVGVALGTGGSVGTVFDYATDQAGVVRLTAGALALTTGIAAAITLNKDRPDTNYSITLTPGSTDAGLNLVCARVAVSSVSVWYIRFEGAPAIGGVYVYHYHIDEVTN